MLTHRPVRRIVRLKPREPTERHRLAPVCRLVQSEGRSIYSERRSAESGEISTNSANPTKCFGILRKRRFPSHRSKQRSVDVVVPYSSGHPRPSIVSNVPAACGSINPWLVALDGYGSCSELMYSQPIRLRRSERHRPTLAAALSIRPSSRSHFERM